MAWSQRKKFQDWPQAGEMPTADVRRLYEAGFAGARENPEAKERFRSVMDYASGGDVAHAFRFADSGAGKLVIPFVLVMEMFPNCWPGAQGQARGDCVSWSTRNALLTTMVCDIVTGKPDAETGKVEGPPDVPAEGVADGVLSTEANYWYRGYDGDGWDCPTAAIVAVKQGGCVLRQNYPEAGVDLTRYSGRNAGLYGRREPDGEVAKITHLHPAHQATELNGFEQVRDFLDNGYGVTTCGGEGLDEQRDENGVSRRSGGWSHAMAWIGADDRDVIKQKYGEPLVLDLNSWAKWNRGPRDIYQSAAMVPPAKKDLWTRLGIVNPSTGNIMIPEGSCWVRYSEMKNRDMTAFAGVRGWEARVVPLDYSPW